MKKISIDIKAKKDEVVEMLKKYTLDTGLHITDSDVSKPWGAYFRIDEADIDSFIELFFSDIKVINSGKLTPKILLVAPHEILSWQYHHRRAELWKVIAGPVDVVQSENDCQKPPMRKVEREFISHDALIRHRLIGAGVWGVVAEIWQHIDPASPSNEDDIVRVSDAYGR